TDYFIAIYGPDGELKSTAGGNGSPAPAFPETFTLAQTSVQGQTPFTIEAAAGETPYRASVDYFQVANVSSVFTQMAALPTAGVAKVVTSFTGIYTLLALVVIVAGALLTRWLVTLTFRSLSQVESTADVIAKGDFGQRLTDIEPNTTEVGRLKTAINAMLGRVDEAISQRDSTVRQMRRFIGDASHELRTPLVTVRGYAELYRMGAIQGDEDVAQSMERIEKEAIRMGVLVEDLLALARLDERRDVVVTAIDLRPIARDAALDVRATSPLRPVTVIDTTIPDLAAPPVEAAVPEDSAESARRRAAPPTASLGIAGATRSLLRRKPRPVPAAQAAGLDDAPGVAPISLESDPAEVQGLLRPIVLGDENRIRQVVANLLGNARRFTASDSPIELRLGVDVDSATGWIEVVDHGEGIPEQIRGQIFQRFWRADTSRARETGGSGLGLSIVSSIVEALHGTVSVSDTPGGGATFRVSLPLVTARTRLDHLNIETQPLQRIGDSPA
ncbi:MAG: HAMP domain-containing histidine kinase, partial [Actinobacteria bacterium]|nr:HAMP domain-containing histidine kinase [Actinomycetota bacterium]